MHMVSIICENKEKDEYIHVYAKNIYGGALQVENIAPHISKQRMLRPSSHQPPLLPLMVSSEGQKQRGCHCKALSCCSHPPKVHPKGTQEGQEQDTGP